MLNKVFLMGRLTRNPELRHTQSGTPVATVSIAVDRDYKDQNGGKDTDFINIVAWRGTAELLSKYFSKGRMAIVVGRLQIRDWTDRFGATQRITEVVADNIYFGDSKKETTTTTPAQQPDYLYSIPSDLVSCDNAFAEIHDEDGDLPF